MNWLRALAAAPFVFWFITATDAVFQRDEFEPSKPSYWINVAVASVVASFLVEAAGPFWRWLRSL